MRLKDAIASLQLGKKKKTQDRQLSTIWSRYAEDGPDAVPLAEYPRPQLKRTDWQCLNGWWEYAFRLSGEPMGTADGKILVPFSPETVRSGVGRTLLPGEVLWYRRTIDDFHLPEGKRAILHFGAVDERCIVWWNGTKVGSHRNGYLSFSFDVTDYVREGTNKLEVCVRDDTDQGTACRGKQTLKPGGMYYHGQSGIWQTVWLETVPEIYLRDLKITPLLEEEAIELRLTFSDDPEPGKTCAADRAENKKDQAPEDDALEGDTQKDDAPKGDAQKDDALKGDTQKEDALKEMKTECLDSRVRVTVFSPALFNSEEETEGALEPSESVCSPESGRIFDFPWKRRMKVRIPVPDPRLWSPDDPMLYAFRIEAGEDMVDSYFAMRSFGAGKDEAGRACLLLNGEPCFFHGVLDQGYWPESLMTPPADQAMIFDITQMKELGFNMLRKHVKIEPARWYWHCDRIGMAVWQDMVNGGGRVNKILETYGPTVFPPLGTHLRDNHYALLSRQDAGARRRFEADLKKMIRQLCNCPCIGMWIPFNEGWGQFDALRIADDVKKADPTRPVDHASGWFDQGGGDVRSVHNYFRPLTVEPDKRAFVISEYGGANCNVAGHSMSEEVYGYQTVKEEEFPDTFRNLMDQVHSLVKDGLCGAVYTQVSDIEEETNGLLTYDRCVRKAKVQ